MTPTKNNVEECKGLENAILSVESLSIDCEHGQFYVSYEERKRKSYILQRSSVQWSRQMRNTRRQSPLTPRMPERLQELNNRISGRVDITEKYNTPSQRTPRSPKQPSSTLVEIGFRSFQKPKPRLNGLSEGQACHNIILLTVQR